MPLRFCLVIVSVVLLTDVATSQFGSPLTRATRHGGTGGDGVFITDPANLNYAAPNNVFRNLTLGANPPIVWNNGFYFLDTDVKACFDVTHVQINVKIALRGSREFLLRCSGQVIIEAGGRLLASGSDGADGGTPGCSGGSGGPNPTGLQPGNDGSSTGGGGGGGNVTVGGDGLDANCLISTSGGGEVVSNAPKPGSGGGGGADGARGGGGGGVLYILADDVVTISGFLGAIGGCGEPATFPEVAGGGGGSGGTIVVAAPMVTFLGNDTGIGAFGGEGGAGNNAGCATAGDGGDGATGKILVFTKPNGWFPNQAAFAPMPIVSELDPLLPGKEPRATIAINTAPFHPAVAASDGYLLLGFSLAPNPLPLPTGQLEINLLDPLFMESVNGFPTLSAAALLTGAQAQPLGFPSFSAEWNLDLSSIPGLPDLDLYYTGVAVGVGSIITGVTGLGVIRLYPQN